MKTYSMKTLFKYSLAAFFILTFSIPVMAGVLDVFRNADGSTRWQYVANFSSGVLIIILSISILFLYFAQRRLSKSNRELRDMKATLEQRVAKRTAVLQETTEQLQNREAYITNIVDSMPLMLIGLNEKLEITQWNRVAEEITGRPLSVVLGKNLWEVYPAITFTPEQVKAVFDSKETTTLKHNQQGQYSFDITFYSLHNKHETGLVILIDDVTKQVKAETKLAERDKVSAMGELASAMAFDIDSPLQNISTSLSATKEQLSRLPEETRSLLISTINSAEQSRQQASAIANNLLELAHSHREEKQIADLRPVMDNAIELTRKLFSDVDGFKFESIKISRQYSEKVTSVPCFAAELSQVFVRLLRSSFYAVKTIESASKTPEIHIEISEFFDSLWIKVRHNGKCLSANEQLDIFQPFFAINADDDIYPVEHRLSYSYFIITNHHRGHMAVTSDEVYGTTFNIQLPLN
jgi:PAS domain S-box-containing protein